jgi:peptidoglycan/LPS O-acetylase OafA/YrhL
LKVELDALRGIAAVMVLSLHLGLGTPYALLASAVDMFFVLSG